MEVIIEVLRRRCGIEKEEAEWPLTPRALER
ncbi:hypothetical protein COLO4_07838 [Corchorus olitorius]|uniref:Uncharacterized protein n=1 Tax=Corchorus olitorius TaxID=93759 RepID=A0A1R3KIE4_9ROSI|nr:hypothetical protein COLO4_07838 [Corchorus olitorius]